MYSYLLVKQGQCNPIIEAAAILQEQKKIITAQRTRERINAKRIRTGRKPIVGRNNIKKHIVHLGISQTCKQLYAETSDCFYRKNWFALSMETFINVAIPLGWDSSRITKLQLELQLKDAQRMNKYLDWAPFFGKFSALRILRIIPSFHRRYHEWAQFELSDWKSVHFVFRAFFRELLACIPDRIVLKLGPSLRSQDDMRLEGKKAVDVKLLQNMYLELGSGRSGYEGSGARAAGPVVDGIRSAP